MREGITYCEPDQELSPFSFFKYLVVNRSRYTADQFASIVAHEKVHIRQWHTADILLAELVHVFLWANPLVGMLKRHLKLNLEYLADRQVLDAGIDRQLYQWSILRSCVKTAPYPLTTPFHSSKLKLRIQMMNSHRSPFSHLYKYAFVLPLLAVIYLFVNGCERVPMQAPEGNNTASTTASLRPFEGYYKMKLTPARLEYIRLTVVGEGLVLKELWNGRQVKITRQAELDFLDETGKYPLRFTQDTSGAITQVLIAGQDLWKRANDFKPQAQQPVQLSVEQLRAFAGKFQMQHNKEAVIQVGVRSNGLVMKELWSGREIEFVPTSETDFRHKDADVTMPITFTRDNSGAITQMLVYGRDLFVRNDSYTPRNEISLLPAQLKAFEGIYQMQNGQNGEILQIQITAQAQGLVLKESWSGNEISFVPENELEFFSKALPFPLKFTKDQSGAVTQVLAFEKDLWTRVGSKQGVCRVKLLNRLPASPVEGNQFNHPSRVVFLPHPVEGLLHQRHDRGGDRIYFAVNVNSCGFETHGY